MEIELKYLVTEKTDTENLKKFFDDNFAHDINMHAIYYKDAIDSTTKMLENTTFRIREENDEKVVTLKWGGKNTNGLHERHEVNISYDEYLKGNIPLEVKDRAPKLENIVEILEMFYVRREFELKTDDFVAVMSIDNGEIRKNDKKLPIFEVEIEHFSGNIEKMVEFGSEFALKYGLEAGNKSKFARGMAL